MKRNTLAVLLALAFAAPAFAGSIGGNANLSGNVSSYSGSVVGNAGQSFNSNVTAAAQTNGFGQSFQQGTNTTIGNTQVGGSINALGSSTTLGGTLTSTSQTFGTVSGNSPIQDGNSIDNGSQAFGSGTQTGGVTSSFQSSKIGAGISIGGDANVYGYKGYGY